MKPGDRFDIAPGFSVTIHEAPPALLVPLAELWALRATMRELVLLLDAAEGAPGSVMQVRSIQGLAHSVAARLERLK